MQIWVPQGLCKVRPTGPCVKVPRVTAGPKLSQFLQGGGGPGLWVWGLPHTPEQTKELPPTPPSSRLNRQVWAVPLILLGRMF